MCSLWLPIYSYSYICLGSTCCVVTHFFSSISSFGSTSLSIFLAMWLHESLIASTGKKWQKKIGELKAGKDGTRFFLCQIKRILSPSSKFNLICFSFFLLCGVFWLVSTLASPFDLITTNPMNSIKLLSLPHPSTSCMIILDCILLSAVLSKTELYILVLLPPLNSYYCRSSFSRKWLSNLISFLFTGLFKNYLWFQIQCWNCICPPCIGSTMVADLLWHQVSSSTLSLMLISEIGTLFSCQWWF